MVGSQNLRSIRAADKDWNARLPVSRGEGWRIGFIGTAARHEVRNCGALKRGLTTSDRSISTRRACADSECQNRKVGLGKPGEVVLSVFSVDGPPHRHFRLFRGATPKASGGNSGPYREHPDSTYLLDFSGWELPPEHSVPAINCCSPEISAGMER